MKRIFFIIFCAVFCFNLGVEAQQIAKEAVRAAEQQTYTVTASDMRSYEIAYESINKKDYSDYSKAVREKIKEKLKKNYTDHFNNGDVNVFFVLKFDGSLLNMGIDRANSTPDKSLIGIATKSVEQASPFPRFPKTLEELEQMSFSVKISFKEA